MFSAPSLCARGAGAAAGGSRRVRPHEPRRPDGRSGPPRSAMQHHSPRLPGRTPPRSPLVAPCKRGVGPSPPACPAVAPKRPSSLRSPSPSSRQSVNPVCQVLRPGPPAARPPNLPPFPDSAPNCAPDPAPGSTLFMPPIGPQLLPRKLSRPHRRRRGSSRRSRPVRSSPKDSWPDIAGGSPPRSRKAPPR